METVKRNNTDIHSERSHKLGNTSSKVALKAPTPPATATAVTFKQTASSNKIIIRTVEKADKENVRVLLKRWHELSMWGDYAFSEDKFKKQAKEILSKPDHMICLVAELNGQIVGFAWATAGSHFLSQELVLSTCHAVMVDEENLNPIRRAKTFIRLIQGLKKWSDTRGAKELLVHVTTVKNLKATDKLLRRSGAKCIGGGYAV